MRYNTFLYAARGFEIYDEIILKDDLRSKNICQPVRYDYYLFSFHVFINTYTGYNLE